MRTVITGGAGFVGSHLCERFLQRGHEVVCVDNLITGSLGNIEPLRANPHFSFIRHDTTSRNAGILSEGFTVGDLDGDGRPDMIEGGETALLWYHNPDWTAAAIATGFRYAAGAAIEIEDIDGDGRADVVTGRYPVDDSGARAMLWFANTPGGWVEHVLSPTAFCHDMAFGDVDGDGRTDMICIDQFLDSITWLQAPADWTQPSQVIRRLIVPGALFVLAFALLFYMENYYYPAHYPMPTR